MRWRRLSSSALASRRCHQGEVQRAGPAKPASRQGAPSPHCRRYPCCPQTAVSANCSKKRQHVKGQCLSASLQVNVDKPHFVSWRTSTERTPNKPVKFCPKAQLQLGICRMHHLLAMFLLWLGVFQTCFHPILLFDGLKCWYSCAFSNSLVLQ